MASQQAGSSRPQMPVFTNPNPKSVSPIQFTTAVRYFTLKDQVPASFPWEPRREKDLTHIHYFEFRGPGDPPSDLGHPGDVWMDTRPSHHALYVRNCKRPNTWDLWPGPHKSKKMMFEHPLIPGRYLWCTKKAVLWYTSDGIRKSASLQTRGEEDDFGRERYRTVGPMERGAGRAAAVDDTPRLPLRTAAQAIAKILETEAEAEEDRINAGGGGGGSGGTKRRRATAAASSAFAAREDDAPQLPPAQRRRVDDAPDPSPLALNAIPLPRAPFPPPPPPPVYPSSSSSLSQALGGHALAVSPSMSGSHPLPLHGLHPTASPVSNTTGLLPPPPPPSAVQQQQQQQQQQAMTSSHPHTSIPLPSSSTAYPSPQSQPSPLEPPLDFTRLNASTHTSHSHTHSHSLSHAHTNSHRAIASTEDDPRRLRDDARRLAIENTRLNTENARLSSENARCAAEAQRLNAENARLSGENARLVEERSVIGGGGGGGGGALALPPGAMEALKEVAMSARVKNLQTEVQEHFVARRDAESKLAAMQEQLSKIQSMFKPVVDPPLSTPGPSPRLRSTES